MDGHGQEQPGNRPYLVLSRRTVEKHVEKILSKLGVENRATVASLSPAVEARQQRPEPRRSARAITPAWLSSK
jgi:hypothetical protein